MRAWFARARALMVASDPTFSRLRMGARVTLTLIAIIAVLVLVHGFLPLSVAAYGISIITAMQGALQIKDVTNRRRVVTRVYSGVAGFLSVALATFLFSWPILNEAAFLVLVFVAVYTRKYGVRWNAVGMFAFMCYSLGSYMHPTPDELPGVAIAILISGAIAHLIRIAILPERPADEFARATLAIFERIGELRRILAAGRFSGWSDHRRQDAFRMQDRIGEAILIADAFLPIGEAETGESEPGRHMAVALFDLQLASETAMLAALADEVPVSAPNERLSAALDRLARLTAETKHLADNLPPIVFEREPLPSPASTAGSTGRSPFSDPAFQVAIQVTLSSAIGMTGGLMLSKTRWFWAILTAFLVFVNTQSRGDTALRAVNRAVGTFAGITIGIGLATLLGGALVPSAILIVLFTFFGFYFLQLSYGTMTFCVTIVLSLLYGLLGEFTPGLLVLRLEETLIGTAAGVFISFAVFPQKTTGAADKAADAFLSALDRLLAAAGTAIEQDHSGARILVLSRHLDRRQADIAVAARPLGSNWQVVRRPGTVRQALLGFMALTYWARIFAKSLVGSRLDDERKTKLAESIGSLRTRIAAARETRVHFLTEADAGSNANALVPPRFADAHAGTDDPLLALDVLSRLLARMSPDCVTPPKQ
ncbi:FUSC family protein [Aureimonas psammosilenae]|uniref:FUSC family protein n=1 Tax=Aureimonas psammosilenae TaxID=2495496 RepID=UPI00126059B4|nr:FUSC family protein [Aureimonas psammosilenae]